MKVEKSIAIAGKIVLLNFASCIVIFSSKQHGGKKV
jgi:hypothetical protein